MTRGLGATCHLFASPGTGRNEAIAWSATIGGTKTMPRRLNNGAEAGNQALSARSSAPAIVQCGSAGLRLALWAPPSVVSAIAIIRPETVIRWHRQGFRTGRSGAATLPAQLTLANPLTAALSYVSLAETHLRGIG